MAQPQHGKIWERTEGAASAPLGKYARRTPEKTVLYEAVRGNLETFLAELGAEGRELPPYVVAEFREYLRCGIFEHGFSRVLCLACGQEEALPFSCKNRFVCPSCCARRMYETAAHLVDRVLPRARYRQWVLSYPFALRLALARDLAAAQQSQRIFIEELFRWQRAVAKQAGHQDTQPAAIACTQRFGSFLNLNVHHHSVVPIRGVRA